MFKKGFKIKLIVILLISLVALFEVLFIFFYARNYTQLRNDLVQQQFDTILTTKSNELDQEIIHTKQNLIRLKGYTSLLDNPAISKEISLQELRTIMAQNLQFDLNQYNSYFAFEKEKAQKYFNKDGYILTVHKNPQQLGTENYGKPENAISEVWTDPAYQTNNQEVWYHVTKKSQEIELTPIYYDATYMKTWLYTVGIGLYENNKFTGMVGIDILLESFFNDIESTKVGQTGGIFLADSQTGIILTKIDNNFLKVPNRLKTNIYETNKDFWSKILNQNISKIMTKGIDGQFYRISSHQLQQLPLTLVIYQSEAEFNAVLYQNLVRFVLIGLGVLLALTIISILFVNRINIPINQLIKVMQKISNSQFEDDSLLEVNNLTTLKGTVETRQLSIIFNRMTKRLKSSFEDLEKVNEDLENRVQDRTKELSEKNLTLEQTLTELQTTQLQLIQSEKMSSLGQMVAGIAHEINNPISFIHGNIVYANQYLKDLIDLLNLYRNYYQQNLPPQIKEKEEEIDLAFLMSDLPNLLNSMQLGTERVKKIVLGLREFSHLDESEIKAVNLNEDLEATLLVLNSRLFLNDDCTIEIIKNYGKIPLVECYSRQINQVFINLLSNAIDAVEDYYKNKIDQENYQPQILIETQLIPEDKVMIKIKDNGGGIPVEIQSKLFDPFFTTKPVGKGTGLGLAISYQIIKKHQGELICQSNQSEGAEFLMILPISYSA